MPVESREAAMRRTGDIRPRDSRLGPGFYETTQDSIEHRLNKDLAKKYIGREVSTRMKQYTNDGQVTDR